MSVFDFLRRAPLLSYICFAFGISWGAVLLLVLFNGMPATMVEVRDQLAFIVPAMLLGPSISGLVMTRLVYGRSGLRVLKDRLLRWRISGRWYMLLLVGPCVVFIVALVTSTWAPRPVPAIILAVVSGLVVGLFEEIGWTGFANVTLRSKANVISTGIVIGIVWGAWHILSNDVWVMRTYQGPLSPVLFASIRGVGFLIGFLLPFRIILVWLFEQTQSLFLVALMHGSLTSSVMILGPENSYVLQTLAIDLAQAIAMWLALALLWVCRGWLPRQVTWPWSAEAK